MTITNTVEAPAGVGVAEGEADEGTIPARPALALRLACVDDGPHALATITARIGTAMKLNFGRWAMEIRPERGGRITSLRLDGEELLDQGIGIDQPTAKGFVEAGAQGWDEMVPTIDPATWRGVELPEHGEAWRRPWTVVESSTTGCAMACDGSSLPWRLERSLELGESVRATYRLSNQGEAELPAYWCSHALFRYEDGAELDVGVKLMRFARGKSGKFFVTPGSIDRARLRWPEGKAIEVAWDARLAPHCGVWICNGDLGGYRQVAIEPATGGGDRPDSDEPPPILAGGESLDWWLEIRPL
jgi:galactose mutarotase-like enzyme